MDTDSGRVESRTIHELERALLAGLCVASEVSQTKGLDVCSADFGDPAHRAIFAALQRADSNDLVVVWDEIERSGDAEVVGEIEQLDEYYAPSAPVESALPGIARRLRERREAEAMATRLSELSRRLRDGSLNRSVALRVINESVDETAPPPGRLLSDREIEQRVPPGPLVGQLFSVGSLVMLAGAPGVGKSLIGIEVAQALASGRTSLFGDVPRRGRVAYVAGEGHRGLGPRLKAWREARFHPDYTGLMVHEGPVRFGEPEDVDRLLRMLPDGQLDLLMIDTVASCLGGLDDNSAADSTMFLDGVRRVQRETGAGAGVIHHTNRAGVERGSTNWRAAVDLLAIVEESDGALIVRCEKSRDAIPFDPIRFSILSVGASMTVTNGEPLQALKNASEHHPPTPLGGVGVVDSGPRAGDR
jgi:hypothetical protein